VVLNDFIVNVFDQLNRGGRLGVGVFW
jgi:hypothetical protein